MICPYIVNISVLLGGILSWGIMWPLIGNKKGSWYPADIKPSSLHGLQGYRVIIYLFSSVVLACVSTKTTNRRVCSTKSNQVVTFTLNLVIIFMFSSTGLHKHCLDSWRWPLQLPQGPVSNNFLHFFCSA